METAFILAQAVRNYKKNRVDFPAQIAGLNMGTGPEFVQRSGAEFIYSLIFNIDYLAK